MTVKGSRYLTHVKRLNDPPSRSPGYWSAAAGSGASADRSCCSCRPTLQAAPELLDETLKQFPAYGAGGRRAAARVVVVLTRCVTC